MQINSDDEMYRVDSVWLGPPNATFPWRARYVSWGIGLVLSLLTLSVLRTWYSFGFFVVAWSIVIAVGLTRAIGRKITHDRPMRDVALMALRELNTPRQQITVTGGAASPRAIAIQPGRPRPAASRRRSRQPANGAPQAPRQEITRA